MCCLFSVYEKEREWGHDPYAPEDTPFGEYTRKYVYTNYLQVGFYNLLLTFYTHCCHTSL